MALFWLGFLGGGTIMSEVPLVYSPVDTIGKCKCACSHSHPVERISPEKSN